VRGRDRDEAGGIVTLLLLVVVVLAAGAAALWWFVLRSDAAPKPAIERTEVVEGGTLAGTWTLAPNDAHGSFVQYRVQEQLGGDLVESTATGRTTEVEGSMTITEAALSAATVNANLAALESDRERRDDALKTRGLQTDQFPQARFALTRPIALPADPIPGRLVRVDAAGDLTLHGITRAVTIPLRTRWDGRTVQVVGELPVTFAEFGITAPDIAGFVTVQGEGTLELQLFFTKAS
jgi:polyisoprenoid-binding protein YceI